MPDHNRPVPPHVVFARAISAFRPGQPAIVLSHNDAEFARSSRISAQVRLVGRGENPWSEAIRVKLQERPVGGLIVADLGVKPDALLAGVPTVIIDHHVPIGLPDPATATVISGYGVTPTP